MTPTLLLAALAAAGTGCAHTDQWHIVRSQNARAYAVDQQRAACAPEVVAPAIDCDAAADAIEIWERHGKLAVASHERACPGKATDACATRGLMPDVLAALKRDRAAARKAGLR